MMSRKIENIFDLLSFMQKKSKSTTSKNLIILVSTLAVIDEKTIKEVLEKRKVSFQLTWQSISMGGDVIPRIVPEVKLDIE